MRRRRESETDEDFNDRTNPHKRRFAFFNLLSSLEIAVQGLRRHEHLLGLSSDMLLPKSLWGHVFLPATLEDDFSLIERQQQAEWNIDSYYLKKIFSLQLDVERELKPDPNYLGKHHDLSPLYRASLVQLMITATRKFVHNTEVLHQAVGIVDRYLSQTIDIKVNQLDEIGVAALLLAYKNEFANAPLFPLQSICDMMSLDGRYLRSRVLQRELEIGAVLDWKINCPSINSHFRRLCFVMGASTQIIRIGSCLAERALLENDMLVYLPSTVGAVVYVMATAIVSSWMNDATTKTPCWSSALKEFTAIDQDAIVPCLHAMMMYLQEETLHRALRFARLQLHKLQESMTTLIVDPYDTLIAWTASEIDRQTHMLSELTEDEVVESANRKFKLLKRREYISYLPGILEFCAKGMILSNPHILGGISDTGNSSAHANAGMEESMLDISMISSHTDREETSMFVDDVHGSPAAMRIAGAAGHISELHVSRVINGMLTCQLPLSQTLNMPSVADSVCHRYPDVYDYLVTYPPFDE